jgi:hypothetical protein
MSNAADKEVHEQCLQGFTEIRKSRDGAWTAFSSRKHILLKVYSCNENADDLLCISHADMELKNGQAVSQDFTCRFQIADPQGESPKIQSYNIWAVRGSIFPNDFRTISASSL